MTGVSRETMGRLAGISTCCVSGRRGINLVGAATLADPWRRHMLDSAQLAPLIPQRARVADLGSGAGFPGLALAILRGGPVALIESDARKAAFLREAVRGNRRAGRGAQRPRGEPGPHRGYGGRAGLRAARSAARPRPAAAGARRRLPLPEGRPGRGGGRNRARALAVYGAPAPEPQRAGGRRSRSGRHFPVQRNGARIHAVVNQKGGVAKNHHGDQPRNGACRDRPPLARGRSRPPGQCQHRPRHRLGRPPPGNLGPPACRRAARRHRHGHRYRRLRSRPVHGAAVRGGARTGGRALRGRQGCATRSRAPSGATTMC